MSLGARRPWFALRPGLGRYPLIALAVILCIQTLLITAYRQRIPIGEGPDEATHLAYAVHLLQGRGLPRAIPGEPVLTQGTHPPLAYALGAALGVGGDLAELTLPSNPFFSANLLDRAPVPNIHLHPARGLAGGPGEATAMRLRWLSMVCAWVVVAGCYAMLRRLAPDRPEIALTAAASLAFWPSFVFAASVFSNDMSANAAAAVAFAGAARLVTGGGRGPLTLPLTGLALGLGLVSKLTVLGVVPAVGAAWLWGRRRRTDRSPWWQDLLALGLPVALVFGWWPLRNMALYGIDQPLGAGAFQQIAASMVRTEPLLPELPRFLALQLQTLLGRFGWVSVLQPPALYRWLGVVLALIVFIGGLLIARPSTSAQSEDAARHRGEDRRILLTCLGGFAPIYVLVLQLAARLNLVAAHARYFFAGLPLLAAILVTCWASLWLRAWRIPGLVLLPAGVLAWALWVATSVLGPAYEMPAALAAEPALLTRFGEAIVLRSIQAEWDGSGADRPRLHLALRLGIDGERPLPEGERGLLLFAQVLTDGDRKLGQVDVPPFSGRFPFEAWRPGQDFVVPLMLDLEPGFDGEVVDLLVGIYPEDEPEKRLRAADADGQELPERAFRLAGLRLVPGPITLPGSGLPAR